jgi:thioredoxin-like negative regulator of GroEL
MLRKLITLSALLGSGMAKSLYDTQRSDVVVYSRLNFEKQVTKNRDKGISIVHFYKKGDGQSDAIKPEFESFATDNKGIFRIGALDCVEFEALCTKEGLASLPAIRIYPTFPAPTQDLKLGEKFEAK